MDWMIDVLINWVSDHLIDCDWRDLQRPEREQKDMTSRWTELGADGPGQSRNVEFCIGGPQGHG